MSAKKRVLIGEDEPEVTKEIDMLFADYSDKITIVHAVNAKQALEKLYKNRAPAVDALILDLMMPYGNEETQIKLKGEGDASRIETGILLLQHIRETERDQNIRPMWVTVITGRNAPRVIHGVKDLLGNHGRCLTKPVNDFILENDIALVLGLESRVPAYVLPKDYQPPGRNGGAR